MAVIAERKFDERLKQLKNNGKKLYSISKLNNINGCEYEAYKTYIEEDRDKGTSGIYSILGTKIHDKLDEIMAGTVDESILLPVLNEELSDLEMLDIHFPKDRYGGDSIRHNWIADMTHFCKNFTKPRGKFTTEELFIYKLDEERYLQGYIDLIKHNKDGSISIYDWKTSTMFKDEDLIHHGRQLVLYAMGKEQEGCIVKEVAWIMLKYCEVSFIGWARKNSKAKTMISKVLNRGKLVHEMQGYFVSDLIELGYDQKAIDAMLMKAVESNSIESLPKEVIARYTVKPYVKKYVLTDDIRKETLEYINKMVKLYESKSKDEKDWAPRKYIKTQKNGKQIEDIFKCLVLCNYRDSCVHLKRYQEQKRVNVEDEDNLF